LHTKNETKWDHSGVIDQNVNATTPTTLSVSALVSRFHIRYIGMECFGFAAALPDLFNFERIVGVTPGWF
jgi:hypothetical protein